MVSAQEISSSAVVDSGINPWTYIYTHIDEFACPEYYERRDLLRTFQKKGYACILSKLCLQDGLSAIIDYVRLQLQVDYSLNHQPVYCKYSDGSELPLSLDWKFPSDPWKRDDVNHR